MKYSLPKVLKRIGLHENECVVLDDGLDAVLDIFKDTTGIRDLEQAAEHLAAHALYMIEAEHQTQVVYNAEWYRSCSTNPHFPSAIIAILAHPCDFSHQAL